MLASTDTMAEHAGRTTRHRLKFAAGKLGKLFWLPQAVNDVTTERDSSMVETARDG